MVSGVIATVEWHSVYLNISPIHCFSPCSVPVVAAMCPPVPTWDGYIVNSEGSRLPGASISYNCLGYYQVYDDYALWLGSKQNYIFEDGTNETKTATCAPANGTWLPPLTRCISE